MVLDNDPQVAALLDELHKAQVKKDEASRTICDVLRELSVIVPEKDKRTEEPQ